MWAGQQSALRPLGAGERIDAAIKLVRANFLTLAKASLVIAVPSGVVLALVSITLVATSANTFVSTGQSGAPAVHSGRALTFAGGFFAELVVNYLVAILVTAVCFRIIGNAYLGQPAEWKEALRYGLSKFGAVIWVSLLVGLAFAVPIGVLAAIVGLLVVAHGGDVGVAVAVVLGIATLLADIWIFTSTRLGVPIVMLEDIRGTKAIRRSISLCRSHWWSVFGTQVLAALLVGIAGTAVGTIIGLPLIAAHNTIATFIGDLLSSSVSLAVFTPFVAAVLVVITIDLRVRKEGFDIQLLASRMGVEPTSSAAGFIRPPAGWGQSGTYGPGGYPPAPYPSGPGGYPPAPYPSGPGGYPPPGYGPPQPGWESTGWTPPPPPAPPPPPPPPPGYGQPSGQASPAVAPSPGWSAPLPPEWPPSPSSPFPPGSSPSDQGPDDENGEQPEALGPLVPPDGTS